MYITSRRFRALFLGEFFTFPKYQYLPKGWGLTYDGNALIMSDGSSILTFRNPETFEVVGYITVHNKTGQQVSNLNELEYIKGGDVYANIWGQEKIAIINIQSGMVESYIDLTGIGGIVVQDTYNVLNGIAYDTVKNRLFVTGKLWPSLYEIDLIPDE